MRRFPLSGAIVVVPAIVILAACGGQSADVASSSPAASSTTSSSSAEPTPSPSSSSESTSAPAPTPTGALFVDVVEAELERLNGLIGQPTSADLSAALPFYTADVPLPSAKIVGAGVFSSTWAGNTTVEQMIGLDTKLSKGDLEKFGADVSGDWKYNSISTTDNTATLVATRSEDGLTLVLGTWSEADKGEPATQVTLEQRNATPVEPAWIATLPALEGGELADVGEGIGEVRIEYQAAGDGLVTARWRYEGDRLSEVQDYLMSGALEVAGFELLDPDSIRIGASAFDVQAGDWTGEVIVGTSTFEGDTLTDLLWFLRKS